MNHRRVVITGMGAITPLGCSVETFWERLINAESGAHSITTFDVSHYDVRFGAQCLDFKPEDYIDRREIKRLDRFAQMAVAAARGCIRDAGWDSDREDPTRVGAVIGSGIGGLLEIEEQHVRMLEKGVDKVSAFTIPKLMANAASGNVSILVNAQGPSSTVVTACASSAHAMGDAMMMIQNGDADAMFTGGSEAALTPLGLAAFAAMKALSTRNDDPAHASRPFDRDRDGFVMGEGAAVLLFEELEHAHRRGAKIYAEVAGVGASSDAGHITQPAEDGRGAALAMTAALRKANVTPSEVNYINAHGTSTILGDIAETRAIKAVFGPAARQVAISSTKSAVGHLLGASAGVEAIACILAIRTNTLPPTINLDHPDPECDLDYVPHTARDAKVRVAMNNSFGFGGHNTCVIFRAV